MTVSKPEERIRPHKSSERGQDPDPSGRDIVVLEQRAPGMPKYEMPEDGLEGRGHDKPNETDGPRQFGGPCRPNRVERPEIAERHDEETTGFELTPGRG